MDFLAENVIGIYIVTKSNQYGLDCRKKAAYLAQVILYHE